MEQGIKLIVGLGNPGPQYENTRHNVGFWLVRALAERYQSDFRLAPKFCGFTSSINVNEHKCLLLLPETFMNLSGDSVVQMVNFYKLPINTILVVHDELDFPAGVIRLKKGGGANGHNGVQSIIGRLGSNDFWRIRVGIGRPASDKVGSADYVLSSPNRSETEEVWSAIERTLIVVPKLLLGDFGSVMSELHVV